MQPKTFEAYSRAIRHIGNCFDARIDKLTMDQLLDYIYSMGLRLGERIKLQIGDIDADYMQIHICDAKGNKDRFVPMPHKTLQV